MAKKLWHNLLRSGKKKYYIRGTSTNVGGTETFNISFIKDDSLQPYTAETITVDVDANGNFEYQYNGKKIYSLYDAWKNNTTIREIEITEDFERCRSIESAFWGAQVTKVSFPNAIMNNISTMSDAFRASAIQQFSAPNATFANGIMRRMFYQAASLTILNIPEATFNGNGDAGSLFAGCESITRIYLPKAIFGNCSLTNNMFASISACTEIELPEATFEKTTDVGQMFGTGANMQSLKLPKATFNSATTVGLMFFATQIPEINLPEATFKNVKNVNQMFHSGKMTKLNFPKATFEKTTYWNDCLLNCSLLTTFEVPATSVAIALTATAPNFSFRYSPLTYQSMLNIARWVNDFTGYTAQTVTFKASAWNAALAEQGQSAMDAIDAILSAKNWTRLLA